MHPRTRPLASAGRGRAAPQRRVIAASARRGRRRRPVRRGAGGRIRGGRRPIGVGTGQHAAHVADVPRDWASRVGGCGAPSSRSTGSLGPGRPPAGSTTHAEKRRASASSGRARSWRPGRRQRARPRRSPPTSPRRPRTRCSRRRRGGDRDGAIATLADRTGRGPRARSAAAPGCGARRWSDNSSDLVNESSHPTEWRQTTRRILLCKAATRLISEISYRLIASTQLSASRY
jgi:hypothetical protein